MKNDRGVVYQLSGTAAMELITVSLWTLRQHYHGPITVFATDDCFSFADRLAADQRIACNVSRTRLMRVQYRRRVHCMSKVFCYCMTPYQRTLYLDADTIINHSVEPFFCGGYVVAPFGSGNLLDTNPMAKSLYHEMRVYERYGPVLFHMVRQAERANLPWINTGAWAFPKDDPALAEMHHLMLVLQNQVRVSDESPLNLISHRLLDLTWLTRNHHDSSLYIRGGQWNRPIVLHNNSSSWYCKPAGRAAFKHWLVKTVENNVAGIRDWLGNGNQHVFKLWNDILAQRRQGSGAIDRRAVDPAPRF